MDLSCSWGSMFENIDGQAQLYEMFLISGWTHVQLIEFALHILRSNAFPTKKNGLQGQRAMSSKWDGGQAKKDLACLASQALPCIRVFDQAHSHMCRVPKT